MYGNHTNFRPIRFSSYIYIKSIIKSIHDNDIARANNINHINSKLDGIKATTIIVMIIIEIIMFYVFRKNASFVFSIMLHFNIQ